MKLPNRIGFGYDVHKFSEKRKLILGGVEIPSGKGLLGHSDADVLLHAVIDALLGALSLGDIGTHFPDTDMKYKGADSRDLLKSVSDLVREHGYSIGNIDSTIVIQKPKILPYIGKMKEVISGILKIEAGQISIKATTSEGLGFTGREEGAAAFATVLLFETNT